MKSLSVLAFLSLSFINCFAQDLYINEVLSTNKGLVKDQAGKTKDCIEIYNGGSTDKDLTGYFLSDVKDTLTKWKFPAGTSIKAKGFVVVWAGGKKNKPGLYTNFKLNSKGETIRLSNPEGTQIHKLKLKRQYRNVSYGLFPTGGEKGVYMNPTIGKRNRKTPVLGFDTKVKEEDIKIRPNSDKTSFIVNNNTGKAIRAVVRNKEDQVFHRSKIEGTSGIIHLEDLKPGKYRLILGKNIYRIIKA